MVSVLKADTNVSVIRIDSLGNKELVSQTHNSVLNSGFALLVDVADGVAKSIGGFGLGSSDTAVAKTQTWLLSSQLVTAPTSTLYEGPLFRATLYLDETQLNGVHINEAILSPGTTQAAGNAYARVVIPEIIKSSDYAYLFVFDCTWGSE